MDDQRDQQFHETLERIEQLVTEGEQVADPALRERQKDLVRSLLDLHATALARLVDIVARGGEPGQAIINGLAQDELVKPLLLLYGLHPLSLEERVRRAVDKIRPSLGVYGAAVEILSVVSDRVALHVEQNGNEQGHGASVEALRQALAEAVYEMAPDLAALEITGLDKVSSSGFIPLTEVKRATGRALNEHVEVEVAG